MTNKYTQIKTLNIKFYSLIRMLKRNKYYYSANIMSFAYEQFYSELIQKLKNKN